MASAKNTDLEPYLQILRSLVPGTQYLAVHGLDGATLASSEPHPPAGIADCVNSMLTQLRKSTDGRHLDSRLLVNGALTYVLAVRHKTGIPVGIAIIQCEPTTSLSEQPAAAAVLQTTRAVLALLARDLTPQTHSTGATASMEVTRLQFNEAAAIDISDADLLSLARRANAAAASIYIPVAGVEQMSVYPEASPADLEQLRRITLQHLFPEVGKSGAPIIVNKIRESADAELVQSRILCVPLKRRDLVVGMITIFNPRSARPFAKDDESLLRRLAKSIFAPLQDAYDEATGLLTRQAFEHKATRHLEADKHHPHCVVYGDMDRLHTVNELFRLCPWR